jgi:predicted nucleic acid-binding protein
LSETKLRSVFDVNVYVDAIVGASSTFPLIESVPPKTSNSAMDAFSLAYDGDAFALYSSPHIIKNVARVFKALGVSDETTQKVIETMFELVHFSGGSVVDPDRTVFDIADFEDNLILDLVKAVDALVLVTSDNDLLQVSPWNHRLIMKPRDFVSKIVGMKARY